VNTTLLVKHSNLFFYAYKHKYKTKVNGKTSKTGNKGPTLDHKCITRKATLSLFYFGKFYLLYTCKAKKSFFRLLYFYTCVSYLHFSFFFYSFFSPLPSSLEGIYKILLKFWEVLNPFLIS